MNKMQCSYFGPVTKSSQQLCYKGSDSCFKEVSFFHAILNNLFAFAFSLTSTLRSYLFVDIRKIIHYNSHCGHKSIIFV